MTATKSRSVDAFSELERELNIYKGLFVCGALEKRSLGQNFRSLNSFAAMPQRPLTVQTHVRCAGWLDTLDFLEVRMFICLCVRLCSELVTCAESNFWNRPTRCHIREALMSIGPIGDRNH